MKNYGQYIKALAKIQGRDMLPDVKLPRKKYERAKETKPREQPERDLRIRVIAYLRSRGCQVKRIENSITGKNNNGLPDLVVICLRTKWMGFIELKATTGLRLEQEDFMNSCIACGIKHLVVRTIEDLNAIIN